MTAPPGKTAAASQATLVWQPVRWRPGELVTAGKLTGLTATIRRYVRVEVTGTYTNLVCAVNFVRYTESAA